MAPLPIQKWLYLNLWLTSLRGMRSKGIWVPLPLDLTNFQIVTFLNEFLYQFSTFFKIFPVINGWILAKERLSPLDRDILKHNFDFFLPLYFSIWFLFPGGKFCAVRQAARGLGGGYNGLILPVQQKFFLIWIREIISFLYFSPFYNRLILSLAHLTKFRYNQ